MPYDPNFWDITEEDPIEEQRRWLKQLEQQEKFLPCSLNESLLLIIPREGIIIQCQRHPKGHFLRPTTVTY